MAAWSDHYRRLKRLLDDGVLVLALERVEVQEQGEQSPIQNLLGDISPF